MAFGGRARNFSMSLAVSMMGSLAMARAQSNALMRRLLREHVVLPVGAPFAVTLAEQYILCDPQFNHVIPVTDGPSSPTREALTAAFAGARFQGRSFDVKD